MNIDRGRLLFLRSSFPRLKPVRLEIGERKKKKEEEGKRHDTRGERYYSDGTLPSYRVLSAGKGKREGERRNEGKRVISFMANKHRWVAN